jgi:hypothetical protein
MEPGQNELRRGRGVNMSLRKERPGPLGSEEKIHGEGMI